jgi:DNA-binding MarR family transcriptional regulator
MSSDAENDTITAIGQAIMRWQDATEDFDEAFGRLHGLNIAERRCLGLIVFGPRTAREIADETRLTPASVTALLDRLEARGLLARKSDADDRRKVMVVATRQTLTMAEEAYAPIHHGGVALLQRYSEKEQKVVLKFVTDALELQRRITTEFLAKNQRRANPKKK